MSDTASPTTPPDWHVLGTGSMACLWAANLAACGHAVAMIARAPARFEAYHGITLETAAGNERHHVLPETHASGTSIARLLVCTKAPDVLEALGKIRHRLRPDAGVVLLQNGMGFHDEALALIGRAQLFCALSTEGAWCPEPFRVRHAGKGLTLLGRYPRGTLAEAAALASALPAGRLEIRAVEDIEREMWRKLAVNCAINALTAAHGCTNGELLGGGPAGREFTALCAEIADILARIGQRAVAASVAANAVEVARRTAQNRSSMLQDVLAHRRTEIDYINGFLCRRAAAAGVPCPLNAALCARIHALE